MWVVALKSRGMLALSKGALLSAVLIGLHAAAKVAPAELRTQRTGLARLFSRSRGYKDQRQGPGSLRNLATLTGLLQLRAWWEDLWWMLRGAAEDTYWQFVDKVAMRRGTAARR